MLPLSVATGLAAAAFFVTAPVDPVNGQSLGSGRHAEEESALNDAQRVAERGSTGAPLALRVTYRFAIDAQPGAVEVFVYPAGPTGAAPAAAQPMRVGTIFPFAPALEDGTRSATLPVPEDLAARLSRGEVTVEVALGEVSAERAAPGQKLILEKAELVGERR